MFWFLSCKCVNKQDVSITNFTQIIKPVFFAVVFVVFKWSSVKASYVISSNTFDDDCWIETILRS